MISYNTIRHQSSEEYIERRSRFIGHAKPVKTEEDAVEFINNIKSQFWDAKHNVYAYSIRTPSILRYSDDGEPQGTAGIPVVEIINKSNITDIVVVVTRYFGGILLGTGGLVRAYSHSAKLAIQSAGTVRMSMCKNVELTCEYHMYGKLSSCILSFNGVIADTIYSDVVKIKFYIENHKFDILKKNIDDITGATAIINIINEAFHPLDI